MRIFTSSLLLLAAPVFAQQFSEIEPNDTPGTAQAVPLGQQCNSFLTAGEFDWYTFTTPGGYHGISTNGGATAVTDTCMTLWDATGTTVLGYCDDAQNFCASLWMNLAPGTYLVRIQGFSATSSGSYSLDISRPMSKPMTGYEAEPNNTLATAHVVADGDQIGASLSPPVPGVVVDSVAAPLIVYSGAVTTATATTITTAGLLAGAWNGVGYFVRFTSGIHAGASRRITTNTATSITTESWGTAAAPGDTFDVVTSSAIILTDVSTAGTTTVITASVPLVAGEYVVAGTVSCAVRVLSGPNAGLSRTISANTATTITTAAFPVANPPGTLYQVVVGGSTRAVVPTLPLLPGAMNDQAFWLRCTSGTNAGESRCILNNTGAYIGLVSAFTFAPAPGDTFEIDQYDVDTYRFDILSPLAEVVFSITDGEDNWVSGWSYVVLDAAGNRVNAATLGTNLADSSTLNPRVSSFRVWPTGTYYVRVMQRRTTFTLTSGAPTVAYGNYRFEVKIKDMATGSTTEAEAPGGPNANNTIATAEPLTPGQAHLGNITNSAGADPSDWWGPITVTSQTLVTFQVSAGSPPSLTDATVNLRVVVDLVAGTTTATAVTGGNILEAGSLNPRGSFNLLLPGTIYYLEVVSPGTGVGQDGNYSLEVSVLDVPTYAAGNWGTATANASGCGTPGVPTINRVQGSAAGATYGELPIVGQTLVTRVTNLNGPGNIGLMVLGTDPAVGPVYNPSGLDLTFLGAPGCTLNVSPMVLDTLLGDITGTADHFIAAPGNLALAGAVIFLQPCKVDFWTPVNALGIQPGNWARVIFGTRTF